MLDADLVVFGSGCNELGVSSVEVGLTATACDNIVLAMFLLALQPLCGRNDGGSEVRW